MDSPGCLEVSQGHTDLLSALLIQGSGFSITTIEPVILMLTLHHGILTLRLTADEILSAEITHICTTCLTKHIVFSIQNSVHVAVFIAKLTLKSRMDLCYALHNWLAGFFVVSLVTQAPGYPAVLIATCIEDRCWTSDNVNVMLVWPRMFIRFRRDLYIWLYNCDMSLGYFSVYVFSKSCYLWHRCWDYGLCRGDSCLFILGLSDVCRLIKKQETWLLERQQHELSFMYCTFVITITYTRWLTSIRLMLVHCRPRLQTHIYRRC